MTYELTGTLRKGADPDTVECELSDGICTVYLLRGVRDGNVYRMTAVPGPVPDDLKVPWVDDND